MDLGVPELLFIFGLALLIFGPAQLPKIGRQLGKAMGDFKRASNDFKNQLEDEVHKLEMEQLKEEARRSVSLEPPDGTVPKENVDYGKLSHQADWEHGKDRRIEPPATAEPDGDGTPRATAEGGPTPHGAGDGVS